MEKNPHYKIVYYYILKILRAYPISFVSLLVLITAFFSWEEFADIFDLLMLFLLFIEFDFLMYYSRIKTPWRIRFLGAIIAESIVIILYLNSFRILGIISDVMSQQITDFLGLLAFITLIWFLVEPNRILPNIIDWSGNSKIARSYRKSISRELKKDPIISSKYVTYFWGKKILSFTQSVQLEEITLAVGFGFFKYLLAGFLMGFINLWSGLFFGAIDVRFSRFVVLFIIVLVEIWNSYKEEQYKTLEKEKPIENNPHLSFVASVFRSKMPYFYLTLIFFNIMLIFSGLWFGPLVAINHLLKSENFNNIPMQISTGLNISLSIAYVLYFFIIIFVFIISLIFLFYLHAHRLILENFARRHNNLKPLYYQRYQEILIFFAISYIFTISYIFSLMKSLFPILPIVIVSILPILPIVIVSILLILNYKFGNKTPLTKYREHIIWLTALPALIVISTIGGGSIEGTTAVAKMGILLLYFFIYCTVAVKFIFIKDMKNSGKKALILGKKAIILILISPLLMYFLGVSGEEIIVFGSVFYLCAIILLLLVQFNLRSENSPQEQKLPRWINIIFGMGGPYTIEELRKIGYNPPPSKDQ